MGVVTDKITEFSIYIGKKFGNKVLEKGLNKASDKVIANVPGAYQKTVKGVKIATESVKEAGRDFRARRGVKTIDAPEVEVKSAEE